MRARPTVVVTRRLPDPVEQELTRDFDARLNTDDRPLGPDGLRDALKSADALLCTVTDKLNAEVLAAEPRRAIRCGAPEPSYCYGIGNRGAVDVVDDRDREQKEDDEPAEAGGESMRFYTLPLV